MRCVYSQTARDTEGNIVVGATVRVYLAGTTTPATFYQYADSASATTGVTTGSDGAFTFYIDRFDYDSDQKFKIIISKGSTTTTYDDIEIDRAVLGTYTISADKTVTTHITVPKGVIYSVASGKTLTFSGSVTSGPYQIFSGSGTVSDLTHAYPEWWGTDHDATDSSDTNAIKAAITSLSSGGTLYLDNKTYLVSDIIYITDYITIQGKGYNSVLKAIADFGDKSILRTSNKTGVVIENLRIDGNRALNTTATQHSHAIAFTYAKKSAVRNCWLDNMMGDGVYIGKDSEDIEVINNWMIDNYRNGVSDVGGYRHNIIGNQIVSTSTNIVGCIDLEPNGDDNLEDVLVKDNICYITGAKPYGIDVALDKVTTDSKLKNIQIVHNVIHGDGTNGPTVGIYGYGSRSTSFKGNEVYGAVNDGIYVDDGATNVSKDCSVDNNTVVNAGRYGIVSEADGTPVRNNTTRNTGSQGLYFRGNIGLIAIGNHVYVPDTATYGVLAEVAGLTDFIFANNYVEASAVAAGNYGSVFSDASKGNVYGNTFKNFAVGTKIQTTSADSVWVHDNIYDGCTTNHTNSSQTVIGTITLSTKGTSLIYSAAGAVTATLPDGDEVGQIKIIKMSNATANSTVSVTHHETSDPEVFEFGAVTDILVLMWNGLEWVTINNQGVATP